MNERPVTAAEIADLPAWARTLTETGSNADPADRAAYLAVKADLLARIADQRAQQWGPCEHTTEARDIAREARAIAENARRLARTGGAKSEENPPPF